MRRISLVVLVLILASVALQAQAPAQTPPAAPKPPAVAGNKIVIVDFVRALTESAPGKAATSQHDKQLEPESAKIEKLAKEITELQAKRAAAKTDAEKLAVDRDIEAKNREGQRVQEDATRMSESLRQSLLPPIATMVNKAVADWAKANNVALVIDPSTDPSNVVFADPATDITTEILRAVNAAYEKDPKLAAPVAAPAAPASAKP